MGVDSPATVSTFLTVSSLEHVVPEELSVEFTGEGWIDVVYIPTVDPAYVEVSKLTKGQQVEMVLRFTPRTEGA